jgi:hypothetical protein
MRSHATRSRRESRPFSEYALHVWTMVARHGMTPALAARRLEISTWRVERIVVGVSRRNASRW